MDLIIFLLKSSRTSIILAVVAGLVGGISAAGLLGLLNTELTNGPVTTQLLAWGFVGCALILLLSNVISHLLLVRLSQDGIYRLRLQLSRQILNTPLQQLEELGSYRLMAVLTDDVIIIAEALLGIPIFCIHLATVVGCLIYLGWLSWTTFFTVLGFLLVGVSIYHALTLRAQNHLHQAREIQDTLFQHFRALTDGIKELKLHHLRRKDFLTEQLDATAAMFRRSQIAGRTIYTAADGWGQILFFVCVGLLVFVLPNMTPLNMRVLTGSAFIVLYMQTPLDIIMALVPNLGRANTALQKIQSLGLALGKEATTSGPLMQAGSDADRQRVQLVGITHTYYREREDQNFRLGPIDLSFEPGEVTFLVGGNGSGKTTLAKLLTGLYIPEAGEIWLGDQRITDTNREWYRQHFSAVFSDFYLFERLLGFEAPMLDQQAQYYLTQLHLDHKVEINNRRLSTTSLSQGQRKRLALLTAYLEDRPFYIFDEWAADQDPIFKAIFYQELLPGLKHRHKTVLVITHDEKYFHLADRLIRLDYGKLDDGARSPLDALTPTVPQTSSLPIPSSESQA